MSISSFVNEINLIRRIIPSYYLLPLFFVGMIDNILNIMTFFLVGRLDAGVISWYFMCLFLSQIGFLLYNNRWME